MAPQDSGERKIQCEMGSTDRADRFYDSQMLAELNAKMIELIERQEMVFISTADADGNCDCSPRFGKTGFVVVIDQTTLAIPEYRGNGVFASHGNIVENPHIGLLFLDFFKTTVGLHVNGKAQTYKQEQLPEALQPLLSQDEFTSPRILERWAVVTVEEAYIHCSKHVPKLQKSDKQICWGTDDPVAKSSGFFIESDEK